MSFYGLEMGKRTMMAHQAALNVVGQNISNASTEGYSRQIATLQAQSVYSPQYGTLESGVDMLTVKRARNEFIDDRMVKETSQLSKWEVREINLENIQNVFNEPNDSTIRDSLDSMWSSFQDLANNSQESATRETVLERADDLASMIKDGYSQLKSLQSEMDGTIKTEVENVNSTLKKIADLNAQISRIERDDVTNANDLRDERDRLTEGLSKVIDLKVNRDNGEFSIIIDGRTAVQGENYQQLQTVPDVDNSNRLKMQWTDTKKDVSITGGKIGAYRELRDDDIQKYMDYLDEMAIGITDTMNEMHKAGFDINGQPGENFFKPIDTNKEIITENGKQQASIYKIYGNKIITNTDKPLSTNSGITSQSGYFEVNNIRISYNTSVDSMNDVVKKINDAGTGVVASLDPNNKLVLRGEKDNGYTIMTMSDGNGSFLQEMGIFQTGSTSFNYKDTSTLANISTNRSATPKAGAAERMEVAITNVDKIAAAKGKDTNADGIPDTSLGIGNGGNMLAMAQIKQKNIIGRYTADDYFKTLVADLAVKGDQSTRNYENQKSLVASLETRRQSEIGVSLDEEMTDMIKYKQSYTAAAKYINTIDEMLTSIMQLL